MNPETKIILDEIGKRFTEHDAKWDKRVREQETRWEKAFTDFSCSQENRVGALEHTAAVFDEWRPNIEGVVDDIKLEVGKLAKH